MKILLLGEYSGFYTELKKGLVLNGHSVVMASLGDGYKSIKSDISINPSKKLAKFKLLYSVLLRLRILYLSLVVFRNYDVVQLVNAHYLDFKFLPSRIIIRQLAKANKHIYLSACGSDAFYWHYKERLIQYRPHGDVLKYDNLSRVNYFKTQKALRFNELVVELCRGIIPTSPDYEAVYMHCKNKLHPITYLPVTVNEHVSTKMQSKTKKIIFLHGLTRYGLKGTVYIKEAFKELENDYKEQAEFLISGGLSLKEYQKVLENAHVIVDQCLSFGFGMNAVFGLAKGKVVLSGNEGPKMDKNLPIINITPDKSQIVNCIKFLFNEGKIEELMKQSRSYAMENLDSKIIANRYVDIWTKK
jgi:glycosyltransferase involved in cell wall biosynthesis